MTSKRPQEINKRTCIDWKRLERRPKPGMRTRAEMPQKPASSYERWCGLTLAHAFPYPKLLAVAGDCGAVFPLRPAKFAYLQNIFAQEARKLYEVKEFL